MLFSTSGQTTNDKPQQTKSEDFGTLLQVEGRLNVYKGMVPVQHFLAAVSRSFEEKMLPSSFFSPGLSLLEATYRLATLWPYPQFWFKVSYRYYRTPLAALVATLPVLSLARGLWHGPRFRFLHVTVLWPLMCLKGEENRIC